jgi:uncharacterized SAM-binding protein YcdF (DUF218 family)
VPGRIHHPKPLKVMLRPAGSQPPVPGRIHHPKPLKVMLRPAGSQPPRVPGRIHRVAGALGAGALLTVAAAEWLHWNASRRYIGPGPGPGPGRGSEAVIVLGYPARRNGRTHPLQRWRCQIAARSVDSRRASKMIFSGAARPGGPSEAAVMSRYARDVLGVPAGRIALETRARSTWQNVEFAAPIAESADVIKFASDPIHAARARRYLRVQRPELAARVAGAADYRFGEHCLLKVVTAGCQLGRVAWQATGLRAPFRRTG